MDNDYKKHLKDIDKKWKEFKYDNKKVFTKKISDFINDKHIDIIVRYLYIKAYIENNNYEKYRRLYEKMQIARIGKCNIKEFNRLITSFRVNGYLKKYPIPINKKGVMLNGSHRLACCLYFNINPYVVVIDEEDHDYSLDWFKENGFSLDEIKEIIDIKIQLTKNYSETKINLKKIYSAIVTPLKDNKLDKAYLKKHANYLYENGINGLFICGNTGNGLNLPNNIKKEILNTIIEMKKFSIICHVGADTRKEIFDFVEYVNDSCITAIACMPPYKEIKKFSDIKKFYEDLANFSNKPLIIYHIPSITKIDLSKNKIVELLSINNVIGIKYTDINIKKLKFISKQAKNKYVFFGRDDYLNDGLCNGAYGGIGGCYNLFPKFVYNIINRKHPEENQKKMNYCIKRLRSIYPTLPGGKFVLNSLKIKGNMDDYDFYDKLMEEYNDSINSF